MPERILSGDEALALGALAAGVARVTSYPGSPGTGTVEALASLAHKHRLQVEWSSNERVALEQAIGVSLAGRRALVVTKSVGFNALLDPLVALALTPLHGGVVLLLGDDPGGYGSQNDQDTRPLAPWLEIPWLEPATPAEGFAMVAASFEASEELQLPIVVRETRSFSLREGLVDVPEPPYLQPDRGLVREAWRFVVVPRNAVAQHRALHARLANAEPWVESLPWNRVIGAGTRGLVTSGFVHTKTLDALGIGLRETAGADLDATAAALPDGVAILKLGALYPPPEQLCARFLAGCQEILVLEENEPYLEERLHALAHRQGHSVRIRGKQTGHVAREGELYRWQIQQALGRFLPHARPARTFRAEDEAAERPSRENFCAGCRFGDILDQLDEAAAALGVELYRIGDPGCLAQVAERLDAKYALGSAVAVADGLCKAGASVRPVALFGDSSFFHSMLPGICSAAANGSDILMVLLDNGSSVTTGFQPHPGAGRDALGRAAPALAIDQIAKACGVPRVWSAGPDDLAAKLPGLFREALAERILTLLVVRTRCEPPKT